MITGQQLKEEGIQTALDSANKKEDGWSTKAYRYALEYLTKVPVFMTEDLRLYAEGQPGYVEPPSKRAWGAITRKLRKNKLIISDGVKMVKNRKAHCAFATLWKVV